MVIALIFVTLISGTPLGRCDDEARSAGTIERLSWKDRTILKVDILDCVSVVASETTHELHDASTGHGAHTARLGHYCGRKNSTNDGMRPLEGGSRRPWQSSSS